LVINRESATQVGKTKISEPIYIRGLKWVIVAGWSRTKGSRKTWLDMYLRCYELKDRMSCHCSFKMRVCSNVKILKERDASTTFSGPQSASECWGYGYSNFMSFDEMFDLSRSYDEVKLEIDVTADPVKFNR
jgi:hypothetical protein